MVAMKVRALALGTGFAEDASWSNLLLIHVHGFDTVQEALESVARAIESYLYNEKLNLDVDTVLFEVIRGDYQDHGWLWEYFAHEGWDSGLWTMNRRYSWVMVDRAPEMVAASKSWGTKTVKEIKEEHTYCSEFIRKSRRVKMFRSQVRRKSYEEKESSKEETPKDP